MVGAQYPQLVGEQLLEAADGGRWISGLAAPEGEAAPRGQGVGVVGAEHPQPVGEQLLEARPRRPPGPRPCPPEGEVAPGGQGVGVVGAEHPQPVGEQLLERGRGARRVPGLARQQAR